MFREHRSVLAALDVVADNLEEETQEAVAECEREKDLPAEFLRLPLPEEQAEEEEPASGLVELCGVDGQGDISPDELRSERRPSIKIEVPDVRGSTVTRVEGPRCPMGEGAEFLEESRGRIGEPLAEIAAEEIAADARNHQPRRETRDSYIGPLHEPKLFHRKIDPTP